MFFVGRYNYFERWFSANNAVIYVTRKCHEYEGETL